MNLKSYKLYHYDITIIQSNTLIQPYKLYHYTGDENTTIHPRHAFSSSDSIQIIPMPYKQPESVDHTHN